MKEATLSRSVRFSGSGPESLRRSAQQVQALVRRTAEEDGRGVAVWLEQEPGSSGVAIIDHYRRHALAGFAFRGALLH
jgi:phage terminase large subunit-like protein